MDNRLKKLMESYEKRKEEVRENLPQALQIQKRKLSCALGKTDCEITEDEEEIVKRCPVADRTGFLTMRPHRSKQWTDAMAHDTVRDITERHQHFDLKIYLDCAKAVCASFTGPVIQNRAFTYVLTHARLFGDTARNMFQLSGVSGGAEVELKKVETELPNTEYMTKITELIEHLKIAYDEGKYIRLNVNVTYLTLISLRRCVRNEAQFGEAMRRPNTHEDYAKLCPHPLGKKLPQPSEYFNRYFIENHMMPSVYLAVHAHLTITDEKTKRILRATFVHHAEWTGLQLPSLFSQVATLYGMEEETLWDHLSFDTTYKSLFKLADAYYKQYMGRQSEPPNTTLWFPFCRILDGDYHQDLSASENKFVCYILAYLVDLKVGFDKSFVRNSYWTKKCTMLSGSALKLAKAIAGQRLMADGITDSHQGSQGASRRLP